MATTLTTHQMKEFVRNHFEDFVNKKQDERMMMRMYENMPDLHLTIEDMIAKDDKVVCRNIWRWTDRSSGKSCHRGARCCSLSLWAALYG